MPIKISKFFVYCLVLGISLAVAEIVLSFFRYPFIGCQKFFDASEHQLGVFDEDVGWVYRSSYSATIWDEITYSFSSEGYRSASASGVTDFSKPRILIVGDSTLMGDGLSFEDTFGYKLQQKLNDTYQVLNFAVQGYGMDQIYVRLKKLLPIYKPRYVIVDVIEDHENRNINRDRRALYPCMTFSGTKPIFSIRNQKLALTYAPERYERYDNPRLRLLWRRFDEVLRRVRGDKRELAVGLYRDLKRSVGEEQATLFQVNYAYPVQDYQMNDRDSVVEIQPEEQYVLDGFHPNSKGTSRMVDMFLEKFTIPINE